ncbi:MAG: DUF2480 family protein [Sinomicrobium sp.]|nr:DUF2480 family protein [Sinomicrobium sp.]
MAGAIINRVANSTLVTVDLEEHYPEGERLVLDIKDWLHQGFILREKAFRESLKQHDWSRYNGCYVALGCTTDAIVPAWAYMLITTCLAPFAKKVVTGDLRQLEIAVFEDVIRNLDIAPLTDKPVIIKGCTRKPIPENAYLLLIQKIQPVAKSIMYGEACSSVPLFKRK